jgi:hypothetical protein
MARLKLGVKATRIGRRSANDQLIHEDGPCVYLEPGHEILLAGSPRIDSTIAVVVDEKARYVCDAEMLWLALSDDGDFDIGELGV